MQIIETTECTRCGGTGQYSYCQMYGRRCFKCGGSGKQYTKRGKAVAAKSNDLRAVKVEDVQVGMYLRMDWGVCQTVKATVTAVERRDGIVHITTKGGKEMGFSEGMTVYRIMTNDDWSNEIRAQLIAYRDSLTLAGKPRKKAA